MHECHCRICGKTFYANNKRQVICSEECKKVASYEWRKRYISKHKAEINKRGRMRRERKKREKARKPDTIIAIGYAERQIADSLKKAGKVNTEL